MYDLFIFLDIVIAISVPLFFFYMHRKGHFSPFVWYMFWTGVLIGLTWELSFHFMGPEYSSDPLFTVSDPYPLLPILQPLLHSLWDGGLFMIGTLIVHIFCKSPRLHKFRWQELGVLLAWGLCSSLVIEIMAAIGGLWEYVPRWWNPVLFIINGNKVTLLPHLVWSVAPIVFYFCALKINIYFDSRGLNDNRNSNNIS